MYENIFRRVEEKYLLTKTQKDLLLKRIDKYIEKDNYYESTITNIYFDNNNNDLIVNSMEKPIYKEKIRLRSYKKTPSLDDEVFLEKKDKYKGVVGKRRIKMTLREFYDYLYKHKYNHDNQIMKEIDYFINYYDLKPAIFIAYDRKSYKGLNNSSLRITLDTNLRSRREDLRLELGDAGKKYFKDDYYIMEIKTLGSMPLWLVKTLSELNIFPASFSKYGKIYEQGYKYKEVLNYAR